MAPFTPRVGDPPSDPPELPPIRARSKAHGEDAVARHPSLRSSPGTPELVYLIAARTDDELPNASGAPTPPRRELGESLVVVLMSVQDDVDASAVEGPPPASYGGRPPVVRA